MRPFEKCPVCGSELVEKAVEKILRGGNDTAIVKVQAEVCHHCGERIYAEETVQLFDKIRQQLERHEVGDLQPVGNSYQIV